MVNMTYLRRLRLALNEAIGAYAIVIINSENPHELIALLEKSSPLVVGVGEGEYFCASRVLLQS